jgi:hypothetical protein
MIINLLHYLLHPLHLILYLYFIILIHSALLRILNSYFYSCVELENRCKGCNNKRNLFNYNTLKIGLDVIEDVKDVKDVKDVISINNHNE